MDEKDKERIFQLRKSYVEKFHTWDEKFFYGMIVITGSILVSSIINLDKVLIINSKGWLIIGLIAIIGLVCYVYLEAWILFQSNKRYSKLIRDIKENKMENLEKFNLRNYILGDI